MAHTVGAKTEDLTHPFGVIVRDKQAVHERIAGLRPVDPPAVSHSPLVAHLYVLGQLLPPTVRLRALEPKATGEIIEV